MIFDLLTPPQDPRGRGQKNVVYLLFVRRPTKFGIKIFETDFVIEI